MWSAPGLPQDRHRPHQGLRSQCGQHWGGVCGEGAADTNTSS